MKERFFWIGATVILLLAVVTLLLLVGNYRRKLSTLQQENRVLVTEIDSLKISLEHFRKERGNLELLSHEKLIGLTKKGLKDPVAEIVADLRKHPELIPYKGVLGGSMGFYYEGEIHILSSKWVLAYFDDGHIAGILLLKYEVSDEGKISWKVIDSYLL
jgi:hypothetical protein